MQHSAYRAPLEAEELLGEWHPLVEQLGSAEGLVSLGSITSALRLPRVDSATALESFLECYKAQILIPCELPAILRAFRHTSRNETRELVDFDQGLTSEIRIPELARASQRIGQHQLLRLRPLRDHRLLQRYLRAVQAGQALAWHTLVYGLTLSIYSLPILQGLVFYERQTLRGFLLSAARHLHISHRDGRLMLERVCADLPYHVAALSSSRSSPNEAAR